MHGKSTGKYFEELKNYLENIPDGTAISEYLAYLKRTFENKDPLWESTYKKIVKEEPPREESPFLSVVMRTQGKRPEAIREAFLCLVGQRDQDFELIIVIHKASEEQLRNVQDIIDEQPAFLKKKIRCYTLSHGTRTTPLNLGFAHAKGEYIAVLDDDDIVFDNWISAFRKAGRYKPGAVLHSGAYKQLWAVVDTAAGIKGLRAHSAPHAAYTDNFDLIFQLYDNKCPISTIAFPSFLFRDFGIIFDESLTTAEDWDYIMRCVFLAGVADTGENTFLYRRWLNAEQSDTEQDADEWRKNRNTISDKFRGVPIIIWVDAQASLSIKSTIELRDRLCETKRRLAETQKMCQAMENSKCWKLTKPLRMADMLVRNQKHK